MGEVLTQLPVLGTKKPLEMPVWMTRTGIAQPESVEAQRRCLAVLP